MEYFIGVDVGGSKILAILASCDGEMTILEREKITTNSEGGGEAVIGRIESSIELLLSRRNLELVDLSGIGIAVPGPTDSKTGMVIECPNIPELAGRNIRRSFEDKYRRPVGVDNDAHAAALAEARSGSGKNLNNFIYVSLGTGIGCGIIINGELYKGADGVAGELSHVVFPDLGSFHTLASGKALKEIFCIEAEELENRCEDGDPIAREALRHLIRYFGIGVGNMVTLFNPEAIVIGGGLSNLGDFLLKPLEEEVRRTAFSVTGENVAFLKAAYSTEAGAVGAVYVCQDRIKHG